ncbi:hypothetical protein PTNB73_02241 [Pyrenophora teres f. teres]|uniref:Uncharacterized protein n=1 Tax=Pyrenophora teres f. teres TaxID=97479 RepID=A0A6S6VM33_9PLEO|nr:hypothetical protein HRS9139_00827 [Pyrenophora teres f. teres]KAE8848400.1 hypothetical protein PTNB85_02243 [Pyrenophora teres f. teres]KAE8853434.1 hypothetical protein HRS9122_00426 [Pyrenophora teres f. teres]KAE8868325.1 hypothetical protein PTNB29_02236 [Pyrenophora teres f. teres]KAE8873090.1 hypothetical protein PTNB73_02241 [Pyrenophora teres f. teres]
MLSSTIIITILSLMGSVTAKSYHNCGCKIGGNYDQELTEETCIQWGLTQPHTHFDGYSCVDKGIGRGIDGNPWETYCKSQWSVGHKGQVDAVAGWCWNQS